MTLIAPSFAYEPWYGDNIADPTRRMESFIIDDLVPFGDTFAQGSVPQRYLIGFSKSGNGALFLILRHPGIFNGAAAWDAPAQLSDLNASGISSPGALPMNFGTQSNFDLYNIPSLVSSNANPFQEQNRLWISGDQAAWTADMDELDRSNDGGINSAHLGTRRRKSAQLEQWLAGWRGYRPGCERYPHCASGRQYSAAANWRVALWNICPGHHAGDVEPDHGPDRDLPLCDDRRSGVRRDDEHVHQHGRYSAFDAGDRVW